MTIWDILKLVGASLISISALVMLVTNVIFKFRLLTIKAELEEELINTYEPDIIKSANKEVAKE